MYGTSSAREILLLAAEDAFEFERWRDAGPVTADIDAEVKAAEVAEFEALGIPMPAELDSLRRELEHAPKIRDAIRDASLALRRSGRASASSLVALAPQQLLPIGAGGLPWTLPMAAAMDPRIAARMAGYAVGPGMAAQPHEQRRGRRSRVAAAADLSSRAPGADLSSRPDELDQPEPPRVRTRKLDAVEAEVVDEDDDELEDDELDDDELDEDERPASKARARDDRREDRREDRLEDRLDHRRRAEPKRARAARARDDWDDDDRDDDRFDSAIAARPSRSDPKTTWMLGGISIVLVIGLLGIALNDRSDRTALAQQQQQQQPMQQQAAPVQPPPVESSVVAAGVAAVDPALGQAPAPVVERAPAPAQGGRRGSGVSAVRSSSAGSSSAPISSGTPASGGVNPFASYKTPDDPGALASKPAAAGTPPPANAGTPQPGAATTPPAPTSAPPPANAGAAEVAGAAGAAGVAGAASAGEAAATPAATEPPKPVEPPKPEEPQLTKSKMTPAIREAVIGKVGELQACYQDAVVGKPDLAGQVVFTISLDQDGVVKKVEITKDEVKYGVAKCSAKKIQRWTLPSAGIPIIFDLPFDFKS